MEFAKSIKFWLKNNKKKGKMILKLHTNLIFKKRLAIMLKSSLLIKSITIERNFHDLGIFQRSHGNLLIMK